MSSYKVLLGVLLACCASATKLCPDDGFWYDANDSNCKSCSTCAEKSLELAPCTEYLDTMCVDLGILKFGRPPVAHHKWHEMEGDDDGDEKMSKQPTVPKSVYDDLKEGAWSTVFVMVLLAALIAILGALVIMLVRNTGIMTMCGNRKAATNRARLFSRDRLNTTEYMNNLAGMDRRLAMDELLEKKRTATFEPQRLQENVYVDEVFINLSGIPRYEEPDYSRSLLRLQDGQ